MEQQLDWIQLSSAGGHTEPSEGTAQTAVGGPLTNTVLQTLSWPSEPHSCQPDFHQPEPLGIHPCHFETLPLSQQQLGTYAWPPSLFISVHPFSPGFQSCCTIFPYRPPRPLFIPIHAYRASGEILQMTNPYTLNSSLSLSKICYVLLEQSLTFQICWGKGSLTSSYH